MEEYLIEKRIHIYIDLDLCMFDIISELCVIDIDMDNLCIFHELCLHGSCLAQVETRPKYDDEVGMRDEDIRRTYSVASYHTDIPRIAMVDCIDTHERSNYRNMSTVKKCSQFHTRICETDASSEKNNGFFRTLYIRNYTSYLFL